ncbi:MAG: beta-class carbonic anhydrase [Acidimicrobiales bacterium]
MDDAFSDVLEANARYADADHDVPPTGVASKELAIVTCIDSRIDPLAVFGLEPGDAKILRNAGARVTDDVERGLALAVAALGVTRIAIVQHTDCKLTAASDAELVAAVGKATGRARIQGFDPLAIADQPAALANDIGRLLESPLLPKGTIVAGMVLDLHSGRLDTIVSPTSTG